MKSLRNSSTKCIKLILKTVIVTLSLTPQMNLILKYIHLRKIYIRKLRKTEKIRITKTLNRYSNIHIQQSSKKEN